MAEVVYRKRCVVCGKVFEMPDVLEPIPEHKRADVALPCNGAGHPGENLGQALR